MVIRLYTSCTPGTRHRIAPDFRSLSKQKPEKSLLVKKSKLGGRNNQGVITVRHRGGGHKQKYRLIDFKRPYFIKKTYLFLRRMITGYYKGTIEYIK